MANNEVAKDISDPKMMGIVGVPSESAQFKLFREFVHHSLDEFKDELASLTFPIYK